LLVVSLTARDPLEMNHHSLNTVTIDAGMLPNSQHWLGVISYLTYQ
jgi:hypothetical protein